MNRPSISTRTQTQLESFTAAASCRSITELHTRIQRSAYEVTGIGNTRIAVKQAGTENTLVFKFSKDTDLNATDAREPQVYADARSTLGDVLCPSWSLHTQHSPVTVMPYCDRGDQTAVTHIQSILDERNVAYDSVDINPENCGYICQGEPRLVDYHGLF